MPYDGVPIPVPEGVRSDVVTGIPDLRPVLDSGAIRPLRLPGRIAVYNGINCWPYFFDPYKNLLDIFGVPFTEADDRMLRDGLLEDCDLLIVPGGPDAGESYYAGLGDKGIENIRRFIREGGGYIGSCAGAFFPLRADKRTPESRMLLDIVPVAPKDGMDFTQRGTALVRLGLAPEGPGALFSLSYGSYRSIDAIYWEGPIFQFEKGSIEDSPVKVLATYQMLMSAAAESGRWEPKNPIAADALAYGNPVTGKIFDEQMLGTPAAIETEYGKGRLHLYSFHPEFGSPTADSWETGLALLFVMNSIYDLSSWQPG
jgi:hypothetical protein